MRRIGLLLLPLLVLLLAPVGVRSESPSDILVIANNAAPASTLSLEEVRSIFLKKRASWSAGGKVVPVHAKEGSALRKSFQQRVLAMTAAEEAGYWQDQKIRRGLEGPAEFTNPLKAVFRIKGSVSYVFRSDYKEGVAKVLLVIPG